MVKTGTRGLAREICKEIKKQRIGQLNVLKIRQAYLTTKVSTSNGALIHLTELTSVNISIAKWYKSESESINLFSRSQDIKLRFIWPCKSDCQPIFPKMRRTYSLFAKL